MMAFINIAEWNPDHVSEWLKGLDDSILPYVQFFVNNHINGCRLLLLSFDDLIKLNVTKIGHQEIILEAVDLLKHLHYSFGSETLQSLALRLGCKARSLYNHLKNEKKQGQDDNSSGKQERVSYATLSGVSDILISVKAFMSWIDRYPFEGQDLYVSKRKTILRISIELASTAQRDQFVEQPNQLIRNRCLSLAELCDRIVQDSHDSLAIQPASLDLVTVKKKPDEELGMHIHSSYQGVHMVGGVKIQSPVHKNGRIEENDEIIQINYQTVVGWQLKNLVNIMKEYPTEILVTFKKKPRHSLAGQVIVFKPYRIPSKKVIQKYNTCSRNAATATFDSEDDSDAKFAANRAKNSQIKGPVYHMIRKPRFPVRRRATISGASPTARHPPVRIEDLVADLAKKDLVSRSISHDPSKHSNGKLSCLSPLSESSPNVSSVKAKSVSLLPADKGVPNQVPYAKVQPFPVEKETVNCKETLPKQIIPPKPHSENRFNFTNLRVDLENRNRSAQSIGIVNPSSYSTLISNDKKFDSLKKEKEIKKSSNVDTPPPLPLRSSSNDLMISAKKSIEKDKQNKLKQPPKPQPRTSITKNAQNSVEKKSLTFLDQEYNRLFGERTSDASSSPKTLSPKTSPKPLSPKPLSPETLSPKNVVKPRTVFGKAKEDNFSDTDICNSCEDCKSLAPEYVSTTKQLKNLSLAKIDVIKETNLAKEFGVNECPSLFICRHGKHVKYQGIKDEHGNVSYMKKQNELHSNKVDPFSKLKKLANPDNPMIVGLFEEESSLFDVYIDAANKQRDKGYSFFHSFNKKLAKDLNEKMNSVLLMQPERFQSDYEPSIYHLNLSDHSSSQDIINFISNNSLPLVGQRSESSMWLYANKYPLVVIYYDVDFGFKNRVVTQLIRKRVLDVAKDYQGMLTFAIARESDYEDELISLGLDDSGEDVNVGYFDSNKIRYAMDPVEDFQSEHLKSFIENVLEGKAKRRIKSQPLPVNNETPLIKVVGANFDSIVTNSPNNVLIEFYAPWCGHCKQLEPIYKNFAEHFKSKEQLIICKIDATSNDYPEDYEVDSFPSIYYIPVGNKEKPILYNGDRSLDDLIKFVNKMLESKTSKLTVEF